MATEKDIKEKWDELLQYCKEHATCEGFQRGYVWLKDAFNDYIKMSDEVPGYSLGGEPGSEHNRRVLAERVLLKLGHHIGGDQLIGENQEAKLKTTLNEVVNDKNVNQLKR